MDWFPYQGFVRLDLSAITLSSAIKLSKKEIFRIPGKPFRILYAIQMQYRLRHPSRQKLLPAS